MAEAVHVPRRYFALETTRRALVSWAEFEVPDAPTNERRAQVSWAEFEVPNAPRRAQVSWAEFETPTSPARAQVSWIELQVPSPGESAGQYIRLAKRFRFRS